MNATAIEVILSAIQGGAALPLGLISLRVFGSIVRGDADSGSDLDVIAVLHTKEADTDLHDLRVNIQSFFDRKASISFYGQKRLSEMYAAGHLFAWHLFLESRSVVSSLEPDEIARLGRPADYNAAREDVRSLIEILTTIPASLSKSAKNATYEAGVMFVCLRNIALSASWFSDRGLDFTRYSALNLESHTGVRFPISKAEFDLLIQSRLCSQRGLPGPGADAQTVLLLHREAIGWAENIYEFIRRVE